MQGLQSELRAKTEVAEQQLNSEIELKDAHGPFTFSIFTPSFESLMPKLSKQDLAERQQAEILELRLRGSLARIEKVSLAMAELQSVSPELARQVLKVVGILERRSERELGGRIEREEDARSGDEAQCCYSRSRDRGCSEQRQGAALRGPWHARATRVRFFFDDTVIFAHKNKTLCVQSLRAKAQQKLVGELRNCLRDTEAESAKALAKFKDTMLFCSFGMCRLMCVRPYEGATGSAGAAPERSRRSLGSGPDGACLCRSACGRPGAAGAGTENPPPGPSLGIRGPEAPA